jgi:hypothetical protein
MPRQIVRRITEVGQNNSLFGSEDEDDIDRVERSAAGAGKSSEAYASKMHGHLDRLEEALANAVGAHDDMRELAGPREQRESRARRPRRGTALREADVTYWCDRLLRG